MDKEFLKKIATKNETPFLIIDHEQIRKNYNEFRKRLPRVQIYYAIKANSEPEILKTLYKLGSSFDVASLNEFNLVFNLVKDLEPKELQNFIWNNIIYANPVKKPDSLHVLNLYKPLLTYDSYEEMQKIKTHCTDAGLLLRIKISDEGSVVKFSNKFGIEPEKAVDLIIETIKQGLGVEGISFHAGSQCNNPKNFINALETVAKIFEEVELKGYKIGETVTSSNPIKIVDIGGGFPVQYNGNEQSFKELTSAINKALDKLFPKDKVTILAEPGRFIVANAGTAVSSVILAKHSIKIPLYHIDDGVYHTFSAVMYDHFELDLESVREGEKTECKVFGPTCDGLDELSENSYIHNTKKIFLPKLYEGDLIFQKNIGAYSTASSTSFNGMPGARIIHINPT
ncbi:type III PLP-dependent enzyme [Candidatus Pacearchaeota archaeon]|nr:type III PLP-dependent enzyme [Candidatus Pacearchaeota archaeon]